MKVREVMTREVITVRSDDNVLAVLKKLSELKISGLPVVDPQGYLGGMITEKHVLTYILPGYIKNVGHFVYEENPKSTKKKFAELSTMPVSSLMRKAVITVYEDVTLCEVARIMATQNVRRIPVIDRSAGKLVGIVARCDVLKGFMREAEAVSSG